MKTTYTAKHWMVLVGAFLITFSGLGLSANGLSLFNATVATSLGFSQTAFTMYFLIGMIPQILFATVVGAIWSKSFHRVRLLILFSGISTALLLCLNALCTELWQFYVLALLRGFATAFCSVLPASMLINKWFPQNRAFMTSIVLIGSSVGGLVFTQVCSFLLSNFTWQMAYVVLGIIDATFFLVAAILISPAPPKETVDGEHGQDLAAYAELENQKGVMLKQAMKLPPFWFMIFGFLMGGFASMGFQNCISTALQLDYGYSVADAANCYSVFVFTAIFGKVLMGWLFDRIGVVKGLIYQGIMLIASLIFMLMAQEMTFGVMLAVCFGLGNMVGTVTSTTIPPAIFGLKDYSHIYAFLTMFITGSMGFGTTVSSAIYDLSGSYRLVWLVYIAFNALYIGSLIFAYIMMYKQHAELLE